jgi:hypothetical protein
MSSIISHSNVYEKRSSLFLIVDVPYAQSMSTVRLDPYLQDLGFLVAEHGIRAFEGDIARLAVRLRAAGFCGRLVDLLTDGTAPAIARERALGTAIGALTSGPPAHRVQHNEQGLVHCAAA